MNSLSIVWFRRDFRLADNPALSSAIAQSNAIIPVYIHDPEAEGEWQPGAASNWWLHHTLVAFDESLAKHGSNLTILNGPTEENLIKLCRETGADAVYWNRLYEPSIIKRDTQIKSSLERAGYRPQSFNGALLREPWEVSKDNGEMYRVYTPFSKKYFQLPALPQCLPAPDALPEVLTSIKSLKPEQLQLLPTIAWDQQFPSMWTPGERGALQQLDRFVDHGILNYGTGRDIPAIDGVSLLSPHLHFGEISPLQIWHEAEFHGAQMADQGVGDAAERIVPFVKQLIWRDFAHHILFHVPATTNEPFNKKFVPFQWDKNEMILEAWQRGMTGIPMVDAGMRQLWQTGWMHNRVRMLVASVLTKNGLVHWLEGARWFWDTLVDANLANNSMGWQWTAGCGVDAAPYFRIFSPGRQGERFDKDGAYIRRWVPELAGVPDKLIHEPWKAKPGQLGITPGKEYPEPVIDMSLSRGEALSRYKALTG